NFNGHGEYSSLEAAASSLCASADASLLMLVWHPCSRRGAARAMASTAAGAAGRHRLIGRFLARCPTDVTPARCGMQARAAGNGVGLSLSPPGRRWPSGKRPGPWLLQPLRRVQPLAGVTPERPPLRLPQVLAIAQRRAVAGTSGLRMHLPVLPQHEVLLPAEEVEAVLARLRHQLRQLARRQRTDTAFRMHADPV